MSWTKRQFVEQAFEEIGMASYALDLQAEQLQAALRRLDSMMATWNGKRIRVGYPIPSSPENSDLDEETTVPDYAVEAIYTNLAIRIAPTVGKTVPIETKRAARSAYDALLARATKPLEMRMPSTMPSGAGNKPWRDDNNYINDPDSRVDTIEDSVEFK